MTGIRHRLRNDSAIGSASVHHRGGLTAALLLAAGLILLQALIGGRVLVFALPGLLVVALSVLIGVAFANHSRGHANTFCLATTAVFCAYILARAGLTGGYFARRDLFTVLGALVVYASTATMITSSRARLTVVLALLAAAMVNVVIGAAQFSRGDNFMLLPFLERADYGQRASGFLVCPNHLAGSLEVVGIFGIALAFWSRWPLWLKLLVGYLSGMCYIGLVLTGSRGGYLSAFASFVVFVVLSALMLRAALPSKWMKFAAIGAVLLGLALCASVVLVQQSSFLNARATNVIDQKNVRLTLWSAAVKQWELQPIVGTGAGTYRFYGRQFRAQDMQNDPVDVHNDYLHLLCEYGLVGAAAFLLFFAAHLKHGWHSFATVLKKKSAGDEPLLSNRTALLVGAWSAIGAYVVHSALDFNLHIPSNALLLGFVFGIVAHPATSRHSTGVQQRIMFWSRYAAAAGALILLVQAARLLPGELLTERARTALRDEKPEESLRIGHEALRFENGNPELYFFLGRAFMARAHQSNDVETRRDYFEKSVASFRKATDLAPLDGSFALNLAFAYDEMGRFDQAEKMYAAARFKDPHSVAVAQLYQAHLEGQRKLAATSEPSM